MPVIVGHINHSPESGSVNPNLSPALNQFALDYWPAHEIKMGEMLDGALVRQMPVGTTPQAIIGSINKSYLQNFYFRIHVRPSRIDLGNLVTSQTRTVEISNLNFVTRSWQDVVNNVGAGVTFNNLPTFPHSMQPLEWRNIEIAVSAEGPPSISGSILIDFTEEDITIVVVGQRVVLLSFVPQVPMQETLEWLTEIMESEDETEQRNSKRYAPRQLVGYDYLLSGSRATWFRGLMFDWYSSLFGLPIWWELRQSTVSAGTGSTTVQVSTVDGDFRVGKLAMIFADEENAEALEIASMTANSLTFTSPLIGTYPAGSLVVPVRTAWLNKTSTQRYKTDAEREKLEFLVTDNPNLADTTGASFYESKVLLDDPNMLLNRNLNDSWTRKVYVLDNEAGPILKRSPSDRSKMVTSKSWDVATQADVWRIRKLVHAFAGSRVSFWLPTFRPDFVLVDNISAGTALVKVQLGTNFTKFFKSRRPFSDLRLVKKDGTKIIRKILSSAENGPAEELTVDSAFDASNTILMADVERLELVNKVRIADDRVTFVHTRAGEAQISMNVKAVKE